ncbi:MAG TPA: lytic transglycosylase domain-containing protein [Solirubrobacteraceae bacterium]|nr:lytic transglycosylase domain-containing protein [Solirubrobacteraceae bacterium]
MNTHTHPAAARPRRRAAAGRAATRRRRLGLALGAAALLVVAVLTLQGVFHHAVNEITLPLQHEDIIRQQAAEKDLDPALIAAVIYAESHFVPGRTSSAGAEGLMQITPATAADIARRSGGTKFVTSDLATPQVNISYGSYLLRELMSRYDGNEVAALAAYNAGPGNADRWGGAALRIADIPYAETRAYVKKVLSARERYRHSYARELGY